MKTEVKVVDSYEYCNNIKAEQSNIRTSEGVRTYCKTIEVEDSYSRLLKLWKTKYIIYCKTTKSRKLNSKNSRNRK